jgi:hypothetical protein
MGEIIGNFGTFLLAVAGNWFTLLAGCVATVVIALFEKYGLKKRLSVKVEIAVLLLFVFFASFQAWRSEYLKTRPGLHIKVLERWQWVPDKGAPGLLVIVSVYNLGTPTIADGWKVRVKQANSRAWGDYVGYSLVDPTVPAPIQVKDVPFKVFYNPMDAIFLKTTQPIATGAKLNGFITVAGNFDLSKLGAGAQIEVACQDVAENSVFGIMVVDDKTPLVPGYHEGMTPIMRIGPPPKNPDK